MKPRPNPYVVLDADGRAHSRWPTYELALLAFRGVAGGLGIYQDFPRARTFGPKAVFA